jgi:hypothetical protein
MVCYLSLTIASGFIMASLFTMLQTKKEMLVSDFMRTLTPDQQNIYRKIVQERFDIYMMGQILGLIAGCVYLYLAQKRKIPCIQSVGTFLLIVTTIQYFFYTLYPKSAMMTEYLTSPESMKEWTKIYKYMQRQYHMGFLVGIVGYSLIAYGVSRRTK